ncbi:MAG: 50S ribosomal protein L23 [Verrucomicrobia bacterium]|nr:50S ribosomal protein L23 [Verrucomicrobiota bacterium]
MTDPHQIIKTLRVTEKGSAQSAKSNQYTLAVTQDANKIEIKQAVEKLFKVTVLKVNTLNVHGKVKVMRGRVSKQVDWKKAIITLKAGDKIELA